MKLNTLDKATKMYEKIKELDKEIITIEKRAEQLANGDFSVNVKFKFEAKKKSEKVEFDCDGSIVRSIESSHASGIFSFMYGVPTSTPKEDDKDSLKLEINETIALHMLGALLAIKYAERKEMIEAIRKLGYK